MSRFLIADAPQGRLFACIAAGVRFTEAGLSRSQYAASLHPFATEERARLALVMVGAKNVRAA